MKRTATMMVLIWWLFYFADSADGWRRFQSFHDKGHCERTAENFKAQGIHAVCVEVRAGF